MKRVDKKNSILIIKKIIKEELFKLDYRIIARKIIKEYEHNINFINHNFEQFVNQYVNSYEASRTPIDKKQLMEILEQEIKEMENEK
jgi:predicted metal-dependent peptidase